MSEYKDFSNAVVVSREAEIKTITPKTGKYAGKTTHVLEFSAYKPEFEKLEDGTFKRKDKATFFTVQYYGSENACKRMQAGVVKGIVMEVRGDVTTREYTGKDGQARTENVISAKGLAVSLNQPGLEIHYTPQKQRARTADKGAER